MSVRFATLIGGLTAVAIVCVVVPDTTVALVAYDVAIVVTTIMIWHGASRPANDRLAWRLLAAGVTCWCVGDLAWDTYAYLDWVRPSVSIADLLYLASFRCSPPASSAWSCCVHPGAIAKACSMVLRSRSPRQ